MHAGAMLRAAVGEGRLQEQAGGGDRLRLRRGEDEQAKAAAKWWI